MAMKVIGVRQLRDELAEVMREVARLGEVVVTQRGEGRAVLVDFDRYNQLVDRLEYLEDSLDAVEASRTGAVPLPKLP